MNLGSLVAPGGSRKKRKRVGRGEGSGHGGTSTRGHKGQKARSGGFHKLGFEGGQMPLIRRLPKRGFVNPFRKKSLGVGVGTLNRLPAGSIVDEALLRSQGWIKGKGEAKILADGDLKSSLVVKVKRLSEGAKKKILAAGGRVEGEKSSHG